MEHVDVIVVGDRLSGIGAACGSLAIRYFDSLSFFISLVSLDETQSPFESAAQVP